MLVPMREEERSCDEVKPEVGGPSVSLELRLPRGPNNSRVRRRYDASFIAAAYEIVSLYTLAPGGQSPAYSHNGYKNTTTPLFYACAT